MIKKREILKAFAEIGSCPPDLDCIDCPYRQKCDKLELVLKKIGARKLLETFPEERRFEETKALTCITANQAKAFTRGYFGNCLTELKENFKEVRIAKLKEVLDESYSRRFVDEHCANFSLFYPETRELLELEKKAKCAEKEYSVVDMSNTIDVPGKTEAVWHDLQKCPEDLPKKGQQVIIAKNGRLLFAYLREDNIWTTDGHNAFENVTAWCIVPGYEVKK